MADLLPSFTLNICVISHKLLDHYCKTKCKSSGKDAQCKMSYREGGVRIMVARSFFKYIGPISCVIFIAFQCITLKQNYTLDKSRHKFRTTPYSTIDIREMGLQLYRKKRYRFWTSARVVKETLSDQKS